MKFLKRTDSFKDQMKFLKRTQTLLKRNKDDILKNDSFKKRADSKI